MKKRIPNLKIISIVLVSSLFIYYSIEAVVTSKKMADVFNDGLPILSIITPEDSSLISKKAPPDLLLTGDDNVFNFNPKISTDILFLCRNQTVYLLVMIPEKPETTVKSNILYDIVSGS